MFKCPVCKYEAVCAGCMKLAGVTRERDRWCEVAAERNFTAEYVESVEEERDALKARAEAAEAMRDELFRETQRAQGCIDEAKLRISTLEQRVATLEEALKDVRLGINGDDEYRWYVDVIDAALAPGGSKEEP